MARALRKLATAFTLATAGLACGGGDSTGPSTSIAGTYTLRTVNGGNLPYTLIQVGADKLEITAGSIALNADNTFSDRITVRATDGGSVETEEFVAVGTYTVNGTTVTLTERESGDSYSLAHSGNSLTQIEQEFQVTLVYRK
jgi:hypothetical protein